MKKAIRVLTFQNLLFLLILSLSGYFVGFIGQALYYLAFIIPAVLSLIFMRGEYDAQKLLNLPGKEDLSFTALLSVPFVGLTMLLSFLTSLILMSLGITEPVTDASGSLLLALLSHALLPALFEEFLFRAVPITLLSGYSKKSALIISTVFFALVHCNLFQIPYAILAGFILGAVYIVSGSVIPSFLLHLCNNILSVLWIRYGAVQSFRDVFLVLLIVLSLLSAVIILILMRKYLRGMIDGIFKEESKPWFTSEILIFILLTLFISVSSLVF